MVDEKIILDTDPEAATYRTDIKGWVSRDGWFYGDGPSNERTARYAGCTHVACDRCGKPTTKGWLKCSDCRAALDREQYAAKPQAEWNGSDMLYSELLDEYFSDLGDAEDRLEEGQTLADLMLMICTPNKVRPLDEDYCCDDLAEDGELPDEVWAAMEAFNKAVAGIVLSWSPGKFALRLPAPDAGVDPMNMDPKAILASVKAMRKPLAEALTALDEEIEKRRAEPVKDCPTDGVGAAPAPNLPAHDMTMLMVSLQKRLDECEGLLIHLHRDELQALMRAAGVSLADAESKRHQPPMPSPLGEG